MALLEDHLLIFPTYAKRVQTLQLGSEPLSIPCLSDAHNVLVMERDRLLSYSIYRNYSIVRKGATTYEGLITKRNEQEITISLANGDIVTVEKPELITTPKLELSLVVNEKDLTCTVSYFTKLITWAPLYVAPLDVSERIILLARIKSQVPLVVTKVKLATENEEASYPLSLTDLTKDSFQILDDKQPLIFRERPKIYLSLNEISTEPRLGYKLIANRKYLPAGPLQLATGNKNQGPLELPTLREEEEVDVLMPEAFLDITIEETSASNYIITNKSMRSLDVVLTYTSKRNILGLTSNLDFIRKKDIYYSEITLPPKTHVSFWVFL